MSPAASTAREANDLANASPIGDRGAGYFSPAGAEPRGEDGGGSETPAARPSWFARTRATFDNSVWAPVALKLVGLTLAMVALSGVGVASMLGGANGVPVPLAGMLGADIHTAWLAHKPAENPRSNSNANPLSAQTTPTQPAAAATSSAGANGPVVGAVPADAPTLAHEGTRVNASAGMTEDGKVILNTANVEDLRHLPGVGSKRAESILALRARLGRFKQVNDLLRVKGIGVRGLKKIMPHVVLDTPKPATPHE
ncbi:MAG TPA: helix-hairpin-helix domain-containing protein [Polyangiaceae bacterium]|nr:helix-hairpin-helix domain-containing protein [Polyangiaceae bacterium]